MTSRLTPPPGTPNRTAPPAAASAPAAARASSAASGMCLPGAAGRIGGEGKLHPGRIDEW